MRFSLPRKNRAPRWVDSAALGWMPEEPLDFTPRAKAQRQKPRRERRGPRATPPAPKPVRPKPKSVAPKPAPRPANSNRAPLRLLSRVGLGLAQGLLLYGLIQARSQDIWPGSDPFLFNALLLAGIFAPLVLLEGLGEIAFGQLVLWTGTVAFSVATLGLYQVWRNPAQPHATVAALLCIATALIIVQALPRAALRDDRAVANYHVYFAVTWTLAARLAVWLVLAGTAFALIGSGNSLFNWLRTHYPAIPLTMPPGLVIYPLLGLVSALAFVLTRSGGWLQRQITRVLLACFTVALPLLMAASLAAMALHYSTTPLPLSCLLALGVLLVVAVNASYRGEDHRHRGRKVCEATAAFIILGLAVLTAAALYLRIEAFGWSANRVLAAGVITALALYGLTYSCAILVSMGGAPWMKGIERVNLVLAVLVAAACLALCTPLADPLGLSVQAQVARLKQSDPALFDFAWLNRDGARFGHAALQDLAHSDTPEIARDATLALSVPPASDTPPPSEIGANITMHTPGGHIPQSLLDQDWSGFHVPPCLNKPAQACDAWLLDLDGDGANEVLLVHGNDARWWASVMKQDWRGAWSVAATLASPPCHGSLSAMRNGRIALADPRWRDVLVAGMRLTPTPGAGAELPCPKF
jgi:hypothetical protein